MDALSRGILFLAPNFTALALRPLSLSAVYLVLGHSDQTLDDVLQVIQGDQRFEGLLRPGHPYGYTTA